MTSRVTPTRRSRRLGVAVLATRGARGASATGADASRNVIKVGTLPVG